MSISGIFILILSPLCVYCYWIRLDIFGWLLTNTRFWCWIRFLNVISWCLTMSIFIVTWNGMFYFNLTSYWVLDRLGPPFPLSSCIRWLSLMQRPYVQILTHDLYFLIIWQKIDLQVWCLNYMAFTSRTVVWAVFLTVFFLSSKIVSFCSFYTAHTFCK